MAPFTPTLILLVQTLMLPYLAAGDIGKYAKHKQKNKETKDTGEQNQHNA